MDISIIIISWNACKYLDQCLESVIKECSGLDAEIIVVDNASTDGSPEMVQEKYPNVKLLQQKANLGFAKANNLALSVCNGNFLFLINSDVIVKKNCIRKLHSFLIENPSVGMAGPRILGADGLTQRSYMSFMSLWKLFCVSFGLSALFPKSRVFGGFEMKWMNPEVPCRVDIINGCFWAITMSRINWWEDG
jgi:GT2 family glycosyltransferase